MQRKIFNKNIHKQICNQFNLGIGTRCFTLELKNELGKNMTKIFQLQSETWEVMRDYKIGELAESEST
jgi:actin-like ATPase involved in cell morphogenesis